jgi:hypothetical protein
MSHEIVMSDLLKAPETMPRVSQTILFPTPRDAYMRRSTWSTHWQAIRAVPSMPGQAFYELRHRAIQWMIDPSMTGWLGLTSKQSPT